MPDHVTRRILALIPAYNEGTRVTEVVRGANAVMPVLVVNDGSTDDTAVYAEHAGAIVLNQIPNQGKGAALRAGFRWALELGYEAVITLDADGQHDPAELPAFLAAYNDQRADLVIGERNFTQMPFPRNLSNTIGRWLFSWALGQPIRDNQSGYRLLSRRMMEATLNSTEQGFEFEVEMIVTCVQRGYTLAGVPIRTIYGTETSHIKPVQQTIHFMRVVWQTWRRVRFGDPDMQRRRPAWLPVLILLLIGIIAALLLLLVFGGDDDDSANRVAQYPTPAPITFIPPTALPATETPTIAAADGSMMNAPIPDLTLTLLDDSTIHLPDLTGDIVFLNFWASWCEPCKAEMPLLQQVSEDYADQGVRVIAVTDPNDGQTLEQVKTFVERYNITFPVALSSEDALFQRFDVVQIPITYIINREGIVQFRHIGELHDHDVTTYLERIEG